jgi:hypothetical protein
VHNAPTINVSDPNPSKDSAQHAQVSAKCANESRWTVNEAKTGDMDLLKDKLNPCSQPS